MAKLKRPHSLVRFTGLLMGGALLGKAFGFLREILLARQLGAGMIADSFRGATTAVLLPIAPLQGELVPGTLVPLHKEWNLEGRAPQMFASLAVMLGLITSCITFLAWWFADVYVGYLVSGFSQEAKDMTVDLVEVMVLSMPASVLFNVFACVELSVGRIRLAAIRASVQNLSVVCGIIVMTITKNPIALAWGFSIAMNLSTLYGFIMLCREKELAPLSVTWSACKESTVKFFKRLKPLLTQPLFEQGNIIFEKFLSSMLVVGTVASLDYARTLTDTAVYFISQPIGYAVLRRDAAVDTQARVKLICKPLLHIALPLSAFTGFFAVDLATVVFQRGAFQTEAISLTSSAMQGISLGIWAAVLGWILVRMLNAALRNVTVAKILVVAYSTNMLVNVLTFKTLGIFGIGLGEAARGIMLLLGTAYALGSLKLILRLIAEALPITFALSCISLCILYYNHVPIERILLGIIAYTIILVIYLWWMFPDIACEVKQRSINIFSRFTRFFSCKSQHKPG